MLKQHSHFCLQTQPFLLSPALQYQVFPTSKGISPVDLLNLSSHALSSIRSRIRFLTTQHHSVSPPARSTAVRNAGMSGKML